MATLHHNISGELTKELLAPGDGVAVSQLTITNIHDTNSCTVDLYIEKKLTGKFHLLKNSQLNKGETLIYDKDRNELGKVVAPVGTNPQKKFLVVQKGNDKPTVLYPEEDIIVPDVNEGKLGNRLKRKNKKLKLRGISNRIKKLSKRNLKEARPELFEINFNKKEIALEALDLPIRCGFEAETFWYGAEDSGSGYDIDDMTLDEVESEFGIPDGAYDDYEEHVREKAFDDGYVSDLVNFFWKVF